LDRDADFVSAGITVGSSVEAEELAARFTQAPVLSDCVGVASADARLEKFDRLLETIELKPNEVTTSFVNLAHACRERFGDVAVSDRHGTADSRRNRALGETLNLELVGARDFRRALGCFATMLRAVEPRGSRLSA